MKAHERYLKRVNELVSQLLSDTAQIENAAKAVAQTLENDGLVHVFGTGHSHMIAEEMFYRAGGLGAVNPILEEDLMLHINASKSTELERDPHLAESILSKHALKKGDAFIIASNSGGNALIEAMALEIKERGLTLIAITLEAENCMSWLTSSWTTLERLAMPQSITKIFQKRPDQLLRLSALHL
jgi:uncharacterized phosphosugar-binding protein